MRKVRRRKYVPPVDDGLAMYHNGELLEPRQITQKARHVMAIRDDLTGIVPEFDWRTDPTYNLARKGRPDASSK